mmetsp:Transcript_68897/g.132911  ORF Transcript_68897/g.132911 Transcript_68897/m.132911 type:complete len:228 (+) Transcript_68897:2-685(+)
MTLTMVVISKCAYALQFDGGVSVSVTRMNSIPVINDPRTVSVQFYPTQSKFSNLVSWGDGCTTNRRFSLHLVPTDGKVLPSFCGQNNDHFKGGAHGVPLHQWSHAAVSYNGSERISVFVNGDCIGTCDSGSLDTAADAPMHLGKNTANRKDEFFKGSMRSAHIWNRALTPQEVNELHTSDKVPQTGLVADWMFTQFGLDSQDRDWLLDATLNSNDGVVAGPKWVTLQ